MFIRVSTQVGMWGFGPIWLTFADKHPLEIDLNALDRETNLAIQRALSQRVLVEVDSNDIPLKKKVLVEQKPVVQIAPSRLDIPSSLLRHVQDLLENGVTTLRREIALIKHSPTLSAALKIEKEDKKRKTVISLLEKQIQACGNVRTMYDDLIHEEEEDDKVITLKVENMTLTSSEETIVSSEV